MAKAAVPDTVVQLVERFDRRKRLPKDRSQTDKEALNRRIAATDRQIDELVYEPCGLSKEEVGIVEGGSK
jgi:hypothetical protein